MSDIVKFSLLDMLKLVLGFSLNICGTTINLWCIPEPFFNDSHAFITLYRRYIDNEFAITKKKWKVYRIDRRELRNM
jgi:hypothetical protein